jgi:hypothetical protein
MRRSLTVRVVLAAALAAAVSVHAQAPDMERELVTVQDALMQSVQKRDAAAWTRVSAPAWVNIGNDGRILTYDQRLAEFKARTFAGPGEAATAYYTRPGYTVRTVGNTAAVTMWNNPPSATNPGGSVQTRVWVKHEGRWQQILIQSTPITKR